MMLVQWPSPVRRRYRQEKLGVAFHGVDIRALPETIGRRRREALQFLATPAGERWRDRAAWVLVVALPLAFRIPVLRKHWALRFLELAGGAAILVKLGQAVRDWEPSIAG
jgi:hypothetical protein